MNDPFSKLGIPPSASVVAIKRAYRKLSLTCHPDVRTDKEAATIEFRELTRIYQVALSMVGKVSTPPPKPKREPPPPPPKPTGPIIAKVKVAPIDDFEFSMFGEASRFATIPPELFEYGGTAVIDMSSLDGHGSKIGIFRFEVPPKTKNGQTFRLKMPIGIVEITLVSERK